MSKDMLPNTLGYEGFVTIEIQPGSHGHRVYNYKNAGTKLFFDYLSQCICGYDVTEYMPRYICLKRSKGDGSEEQLTNYVRVSGGIWGNPAKPSDANPDDTSGWVLFNSLITYMDIIGSATGSINDEFLELVNENKEVLASVSIKEPLSTAISSTADALVTWLIRIGQTSDNGGQS